MNKKGALELSMNMLVILIISVVILVGGVALLYKFIAGAEEIKTQLDERTETELERLLVDQGKQVALPLDKATVSRGKNHVFGLGILNIGGVPSNEFTVQVEVSTYIPPQGEVVTEDVKMAIETAALEWILHDTSSLLIEEHEHRKEPIAVVVSSDAPTGMYVYNVRVFDSLGVQYGTLQKFTVTVV